MRAILFSFCASQKRGTSLSCTLPLVTVMGHHHRAPNLVSPSLCCLCPCKTICALDATSNNALEWWLETEKHYPLSKIATKYLCSPATSVPPKRAFSVARYVVNKKRPCLLPENVSMLVVFRQKTLTRRIFL